MKKILWLLALVGALLLIAVPVLADDSFYVIGTGAQRVGTKITSLPCTITTPGYYYLTGNLSYTDGNAITVDADNVTLDLMGFVLTGHNNNTYYGIVAHSKINLEVRNGTITGWNTGIFEGTVGGANHRVINIRANGNSYGIILNGTGHLVKGCTASPGSFASGDLGIYIGGGTVSGCTVMNFTPPSSTVGLLRIGVGGGTASGNVVLNCAGIGIRGDGPTTISHNTVFNCTTGISSGGGGSIIGNAVLVNNGQTGIAPSTSAGTVLDQNSVVGAGTHLVISGTGLIRVFNGGF